LIQSQADDIILQYAGREVETAEMMYPPVAADTYPPSYEKIVPKSVLKALFYCSAKERKHCEVQYGIPAVVSIVITIIR